MHMVKRISFEHLFLYLFFILIPFGIKKVEAIFVYPWGSKAIFLYAIDGVVAWLFIMWILRKGWRNIVYTSSTTRALGLFVGIALLSLLFASHRGLGAYTMLHLLEGVFLYFYFATHQTLTRDFAFRAILVGTTFQTFIGLLQFKAQKSIGISYLGESHFGAPIPGTATFYFGIEKFVRVPGTFLHPNILGAFLFMSSLLILYYVLRSKDVVSSMLWLLFYYATNLLLLLTFSRSSITTILVLTVIYLIVSYKKSRIQEMYVFVVWGLVFLTIGTMFGNVLTARFQHSFDELSYKHRVIYNHIGLEVLSQRPLLGVGVGNFVDYAFHAKLYQAQQLSISYLYQPIHNLYLLIGVETGMFGVLAFLAFLALLFRSRFGELYSDPTLFVVSCVLAGFLMLGFADHYFWDLEQGIVMLWTMLGLFALVSHKKQTMGVEFP